jgi:NAD(P)-dependent dehydrogenase (short-subunit alcohol dehydrogenase family)
LDNDTQSPGRILIVGASGLLGQALTRLLLKHTDSDLLLAGRDMKRVKDAAGKEASQRLECIELNPHDPQEARKATQNVRLVLNATSRGPHNRILIDAAVEASADYMDAQIVNELLKPEAALTEKIEKADRCCVIQAGLHPGVPAALARYAATQLDSVEKAMVGATINPEHGILYSSGVCELMELFGDYIRHPADYGYGKKSKGSKYPKMKFSFGFGEKSLYPMQMAEMAALPEMIPGLKEAGLYISGSNWLADYIATPIILFGAFIAPKKLAAPLGHLFCWSNRQFMKPPYGTVLQLEADGVHKGKSTHLRVSLFHTDEYDFTAIPMVSMIRQMLTGHARKPGVHMMGHLCDPVLLMEDIKIMGICVESELTINR